MTAVKLLPLDFFHEWSVHVTCTPATAPDVLQFRLLDDVIRGRTEQKKEEWKEFKFNMKTENLEMVVEDLVNRSILDEGNTRVAMRMLLEKVNHYRELRRARCHSTSDAQPSSHTDSHPSESAALYNRRRSEECNSIAVQPHKRIDSSETNGTNVTALRRTSVSRSSGKDSEAKKLLRRRSLKVLIEDISEEDGSTVVACQLHTGLATVAFNFNCDSDTAEEITQNLNAYLTDEDHNAKALQQIGEIIETVKANKEQPKVAKSIYLQKHQKQDSVANTPIHSRSSSKDLVYLGTNELSVVGGVNPQSLSRSNSTELDTIGHQLKQIAKDRSPSVPHVITDGSDSSATGDPLNQVFSRDRSITWSAASRKAANEEANRKMSVPSQLPVNSQFGFHSNQLSVVHAGGGAPISAKKLAFLDLPQDINEDELLTDEMGADYRPDERLQHLKKSIENIMAREYYGVSNAGDKSHAPQQYSRSLTSSPLAKRKYGTRQLSSTSTRTEGDLTSPNDSLGASSVPLSACNSLTCDSGFCSILPQAFRKNSVSEPIAETTSKVGRFAVGVVKEKVTSKAEVTIHPPTAVILEKATTVSPHAIIGGLPGPDNHIADCTCPAKMAGDDYNRIDAELHQIKARQEEERKKMEDKHDEEILMYLSDARDFYQYRTLCRNCAQKQSSTNSSTSLCDTHAIAKTLRKQSIGQTLNKALDTVPLINTPAPPPEASNHSPTEMNFVSSYLRTGKHHGNMDETGNVRRIRHNSVEQLMQRMISREDEVGSVGTESSSSTIREEDNVNGETDDGFEDQVFSYSSVRSPVHVIPSKPDVRQRTVTHEVAQSHRAILEKVQSFSSLQSSASSHEETPTPALVTSQQEHVKQALGDSRAQIIKSLDSFEFDRK